MCYQAIRQCQKLRRRQLLGAAILQQPQLAKYLPCRLRLGDYIRYEIIDEEFPAMPKRSAHHFLELGGVLDQYFLFWRKGNNGRGDLRPWLEMIRGNIKAVNHLKMKLGEN